MKDYIVSSGPLGDFVESLATLFRVDEGYLNALQTLSLVATKTWVLDSRTTITAWTSGAQMDRGYIGLCRSLLTDPEERCADFSLLLASARHWFREQQIKEIYAPVDGSTWFQYRLSPPAAKQAMSFAWEPCCDVGLEEALICNHFETEATYHSTGFESNRFELALDLLESSYQKTISLGLSLVPISQVQMTDAAPALFDIAHHAFEKAFLYEPLSYQTFGALYLSRLKASESNLSFVLMSPERSILGFIYAFRDQDFAVVKTVAISEHVSHEYNFGRSAPSLALLYCVLREAKDRGLKGGVSALVHDQASSTTMERFQRWAQTWRHDYHLFRTTDL